MDQFDRQERRFIFISGGVVSGVGKGITTASLALLLKSRGFTVSPIKCDMYVNVDAGTMNPTVHGEVFVTADGMETDQDVGNYERFLNQSLTADAYTTTGQVYRAVIQKERQLSYHGRCVEVVPDIPEEIIQRILKAGENSDFTLVELGGTVGEYQSVLFLEATRMLAKRMPGRTAHVHVSYFPFLKNLGELKSKPTQLSIRRLNECGIIPDFIVARSATKVDTPRFNTLCQNSNLTPDQIIFCPDVDNIYTVPDVLDKQHFAEKILRTLGFNMVPKPFLESWRKRLSRLSTLESPNLRIGMVEKYRNVGEYTLADTHISVLEALRHASIEIHKGLEIVWIDADSLSESSNVETLSSLSGIVVPQGWGSRGAEGKIKAIQYARENDLPFLGLCYGMQMAAIEFARSIGLDNANSVEVDSETPYPIIHIMSDQVEKLANAAYGGTIRLGSYPCKLVPGSKLSTVYDNVSEVSERHRHRYEFNNEFRGKFENNGMRFSGLSPDGKLVEALEIPEHRFFIAVQFHPEFQSRFEKPHPLFVSFLRAAGARVPETIAEKTDLHVVVSGGGLRVRDDESL